MSGMKWQQPPAGSAGRNGKKWANIAAALRERPGQWALIFEGVSGSTGSSFRNRFPDTEVTVRTRKDGTRRSFDVYARFPGDAA